MSLFDLQVEVDDLMLEGTGKLLIDESKQVLVGAKEKGKINPLDDIVFKNDITVDEFEKKLEEANRKKIADELEAGRMSNWDRKWGKPKKEKKGFKTEAATEPSFQDSSRGPVPRGPRIPKVS